jgi:hypothetical protein
MNDELFQLQGTSLKRKEDKAIKYNINGMGRTLIIFAI